MTTQTPQPNAQPPSPRDLPPSFSSPLPDDVLACMPDFVQWTADLLHVAFCADCRARGWALPAPSPRARRFLAYALTQPAYAVLLRRLGGAMLPPSLAQAELDTLDYLQQERARADGDRHARLALLQDCLRRHDDLASLLHPTTPPTPQP